MYVFLYLWFVILFALGRPDCCGNSTRRQCHQSAGRRRSRSMLNGRCMPTTYGTSIRTSSDTASPFQGLIRPTLVGASDEYANLTRYE